MSSFITRIIWVRQGARASATVSSGAHATLNGCCQPSLTDGPQPRLAIRRFMPAQCTHQPALGGWSSNPSARAAERAWRSLRADLDEVIILELIYALQRDHQILFIDQIIAIDIHQQLIA